MSANPYKPPHQEDAQQRSWLPILLFLGISIGVCVFCFLCLEVTVAAGVAALSIVSYFCVGRISDRPAGFAKLTIVELVVLLAILGILWGLSFPAVSSAGRRRNRQPPVESSIPNELGAEDASRKAPQP